MVQAGNIGGQGQGGSLALLALSVLVVTTCTAQIPKSALAEVVETHKASILRYIDAAPDSMLGFRPTPGVRTFAKQIEHAAVADAMIAHMVLAGNMNTPGFGESAVYRHNKAALRAYATKAMDHTIEMLKTATDAQLAHPFTVMNMTTPKYRFLLERLDHFPWTLGQTVPYLRMNGVTPPEYTPF